MSNGRIIVIFICVVCVTYLSKTFAWESGGNKQHRSLINSTDIRFLAVGDWGSDSERQQEDANAIGQWCDENRCDFIISTGDNFYDNGVYSADDERFETTWRKVYNHPAIADLTWYISAGNHDHGYGYDLREWYQVEHSKIDPRWHFPDLAHSFTISTPFSMMVKFVSYDTESILQNKNNATGMLQFLESELEDPISDWIIVFGHHPCYSAGMRAGSRIIRKRVLPILTKYNVDIYLTGHEHNLEHWQVQNETDIDHIITGAGGKIPYEFNERNYEKMKKLGVEMRFFKDNNGFAYFVINEDSIYFKFINSKLEVLYEHTRRKHKTTKYPEPTTLLKCTNKIATKPTTSKQKTTSNPTTSTKYTTTHTSGSTTSSAVSFPKFSIFNNIKLFLFLTSTNYIIIINNKK